MSSMFCSSFASEQGCAAMPLSYAAPPDHPTTRPRTRSLFLARSAACGGPDGQSVFSEPAASGSIVLPRLKHDHSAAPREGMGAARIGCGSIYNYLTLLSQPGLRRAGARSHDFVVAIAFAHPPSTSPRDPNSIPRPRNADLSPLWKIGRRPSSLPAHMFGDPERHTLAVAWS